MRDPLIAEAGRNADGGALFEPRGFWDIAQLDTSDAVTSGEPNVVKLDREHFRNGARWPIILTRIALAPIAYLLEQQAGVAPVDATSYRNDGMNLGLAQVLIDAPFRQGYSKRYIVGRGMQARPTSEPGMRYSTTTYASGLWNVVRMGFDKPLVLPNKGAVEIGIGTYINANLAADSSLGVYVNVEERGGLWSGASRAAVMLSRVHNANGGYPFEPDAWPAFFDATINGRQTIEPYPFGTFRAQDYIKQNPSRGGAGGICIDAINVHVPQSDYDDDLQGTAVAGHPVTPFSLRLPCAARTRAGGTGQWWWRPNAPLGLMFNEITPAFVYDLPQPITLAPGDCLDVALQFPWLASNAITPKYQIGAALTGFAVIEG